MSDAQQVIADVASRHQLVKHDRRAWWCACGADCLNTEFGWSEHLAEMVDAALGGLRTQEREIDYGLGILGVERRKQVRWVSGWTPEERSATDA